jgi:fructose-1,6-bisphosphatase II
VHLIPHGDTAPAMAVARAGSGVDLVMGVGGTPEGVIAAAALKCLGGAMQARLWPRSDGERRALLDAGYDVDAVLSTDDLVAGQDVFVAATGVTTGALLRGVLYTPAGALTESLVMRSRSGTVRRITAEHTFEKLERFTGQQYR